MVPDRSRSGSHDSSVARQSHIQAKPPHPPAYIIAATKAGTPAKVSKESILHLSGVGYAAHFRPNFTDFSSSLEFGSVLYGPLRLSLGEAKTDMISVRAKFNEGVSGLRKVVAIWGAEGGSYSRANKQPVLSSSPLIAASWGTGKGLRIFGSRRPFVSVSLPDELNLLNPSPILRRVIDLTADLLGACIDTELNLLPSFSLVFDILTKVLDTDHQKLYEMYKVCEIIFFAISSHAVFARLKNPQTAEDDLVINGLMRQLADKAKPADKLSMSSIKKGKKTLARLNRKKGGVVIWNLPRNVHEEILKNYFENFKIKNIHIPKNPKTHEARGFAFAEVPEDQIQKMMTSKLELEGRQLVITQRQVRQGIADKLQGWEHGCNNESSIFSLPEELQEKIRNIVKSKPGANIGVLKQTIGQELNPQKYGFKNLFKALQSVNGVHVTQQQPPGRVPAYLAFPT